MLYFMGTGIRIETFFEGIVFSYRFFVEGIFRRKREGYEGIYLWAV